MNFRSMAGGARGAARDANVSRRKRAARPRRGPHSALYFDPSGRTRLINVNARSNAIGSSIFVNMSPLWEVVS